MLGKSSLRRGRKSGLGIAAVLAAGASCPGAGAVVHHPRPTYQTNGRVNATSSRTASSTSADRHRRAPRRLLRKRDVKPRRRLEPGDGPVPPCTRTRTAPCRRRRARARPTSAVVLDRRRLVALAAGRPSTRWAGPPPAASHRGPAARSTRSRSRAARSTRAGRSRASTARPGPTWRRSTPRTGPSARRGLPRPTPS